MHQVFPNSASVESIFFPHREKSERT